MAETRERMPRGMGSRPRPVPGRPGLWSAKISVPAPGGRRRRVSVYGRSEAEVIAAVRRQQAELDRRGALPTTSTTLARWLTYWLDEIAADRLKPRTLLAYRTAVHEWIIPAIGNRKLARLRTGDIRAMHTYVRSKTRVVGRDEDGQPILKRLSSTSALNAHRVLSVALNDAVREIGLGVNVAALVHAPGRAAATRRGLTVPEALAVLRVAGDQDGPDARLGSRWLAALLLGIRQGERLGLRWSHLDLDAGIVDVAWSLTRIPYSHGCAPRGTRPTCGRQRGASCPRRLCEIPPDRQAEHLSGNLYLMRPKSAAGTRVLPLPEPLRLALLRRHETYQAERQAHDYTDHGLVWCEADGSPVDSRDDWATWGRLLETAGVPRVTQHEARHTTASLLLSLGIPETVIMAILGHSEIVTTQRYAHADLTSQRRALDGLGNLLAIEG